MKSFSQILTDGSSRAANGCLEWAGYKAKTGYGQFRQKWKTYYAHRDLDWFMGHMRSLVRLNEKGLI